MDEDTDGSEVSINIQKRGSRRLANRLACSSDLSCGSVLTEHSARTPFEISSNCKSVGPNEPYTETVDNDSVVLPSEDKSDNDIFCRICHESDGEELLITPCRCKGTLSMVHRSCLEKWLAASDSSNCELCGQFYVTLRTPKYRYLPSILSWLRSDESCRDVRELVLDLMALCVFTPMAVLGTYLGLFAAENFYLAELDPTRRDVTSARLVTLVVMSLMATIDLAYISWLTVRTQYHVQQWYSWWRRQCTVKLFLPSEMGI